MHFSLKAPFRQSLCGSSVPFINLMSGHRDQLRDDMHFRLLRLLQDNPEMSQRELANAVGISVGGMHYVLNALIDKGLVKLGNFTAARDKRRYAYLLTPKGIAEKAALTRSFLKRKRSEYEAIKAEIDSLEKELGLGTSSTTVSSYFTTNKFH